MVFALYNIYPLFANKTNKHSTLTNLNQICEIGERMWASIMLACSILRARSARTMVLWYTGFWYTELLSPLILWVMAAAQVYTGAILNFNLARIVNQMIACVYDVVENWFSKQMKIFVRLNQTHNRMFYIHKYSMND